MRLFLISVLFLLPALLPAQGKKKPPVKDQPPKILIAFPFGIKPGSTTKVVVRGLKLDTLKEITCKVGTAKVLKKSKVGVPPQQDVNRVGDSQAEVELTIPADAKGDSVEITPVGPTLTGTAHKVLLDRVTIIAEKEPNNGFKQAQAIMLGQTIQGSIANGTDVDVYKFDGKANQTVIVEVFAARLGSALDSFITVYDAKGEIIDSNDDIADSTDSRLEVKLPSAGVYYVSVSDAHDVGGPMHPYRLLLKAK